MKRKHTRFFAAVMIICLIMVMVPGAALAETSAQRGVYLALGDSISTGYGLETPETESFVNLVAAEKEYTIVYNEAVNGNTTEGILDQLKSGELDGKLKAADLVTITVGGNDLMFPLYEQIAAVYNTLYKKASEEALTGSGFTEFVSNGLSLFTLLDLLDSAMMVLQGPEYNGIETMDPEVLRTLFGEEVKCFVESDGFLNKLEEYRQNLNEIFRSILEENPEVRVIITTQYNPYESFVKADDAPEAAVVLQESIKDGAEILNDVIESVVEELNTENIYIANEVYNEFAESEENLCNAAILGTDIELDFHPNAAGHAKMAEIILSLMDECGIEPEELTVKDMKAILSTVKLTTKSKLVKVKDKSAIQLSWKAPESVSLDGYEVFRSTKKNNGYGTEPIFETGKTSYKNTSVKKNRTYYYKVRGYVEFEGKRVYTPWSTKAYRRIK